MKTYLHITHQEWPDRITLYPRIPERGIMVGEPAIPRICVCPTLLGCVLATSYDGAIGNACRVYECRTSAAIKAHQVFDSSITDEHWILQPTEFKLKSILNLYNLPEFKSTNIKQVKAAYNQIKIYINKLIF